MTADVLCVDVKVVCRKAVIKLKFKGIFSDSNSIFVCHASKDIKLKRLFPKTQLILIFRLQVMHDYVH